MACITSESQLHLLGGWQWADLARYSPIRCMTRCTDMSSDGIDGGVVKVAGPEADLSGLATEEKHVDNVVTSTHNVAHTASDDAAWQWLFTPEDLAHTPSVLNSGLSQRQERYNRWKGVQLIFRIGDYMRLGNHVTCTAAIFFQRFYMRKAMPPIGAADRPRDTYTFQEMAPTCIYLACKVEEAHRKLHGIVEATMAVLDRTPTGIERAEAHIYRADVTSRDYRRWKDVTLLHEERLLETLCFDMIVEQPYPIAIKACQRMATDRDVAQVTIVVLNMLLHGSVCLFADAATLAACAFLKACQYIEKNPNDFLQGTQYAERQWYEAFDVDQDEIDEIFPAIDEFLTFHQERIAPITSASQSSSSTPLPASHTNVTSRSDEADPASSSSALADNNKDKEHVANTPIATQPDGPMMETAVRKEEEELEVQRESRTDDFRPISRHGSRGDVQGPPPPLFGNGSREEGGTAKNAVTDASEEHDVVYTMVSPKLPASTDDDQKRLPSIAPHEESTFAKIEHEQAEQENHLLPKTTLSEGERFDSSINKRMDDSEEEGAL